jgi:Na+-transporting NADH:ubiquinone oxidoreductase subunit A
MHYKIRQGHWPSDLQMPVQEIEDRTSPVTAAIVGADFPDLRPAFAVRQGDTVAAGQVLFTDRKHPQIAHVAPMAGTVAKIEYGARLTLSACIIKQMADPAFIQLPSHDAPLDDSTEAMVRAALLGRGMWPALRTRPFGRTPDPAARPLAIFVNAVGGAGAPDPHAVLEGRTGMFAKGIAVLTKLTDGLIHVCKAQGAPLCPITDRVRVATFSGTMAAGLAGTHIDRLYPVRSGRKVWTIGYQDVAAIGHLFRTGQYTQDHVIALHAEQAPKAALIRTISGARIADIAGQSNAAFRSGSLLNWREAVFLGRFDAQITTVARPAPNNLTPLFSGIHSRALIPKASLDRALAPRVFAVPLMRALSVGDSEAARRLGCLALVEEDVAILSHLCTSGADYGILLRQVLDELMEDAA